MAILITGGAGFIGSHTVVELLQAGKDVVLLDNFSNSKPVVLNRIRSITGKDFPFYPLDLLDRAACRRVFSEHNIDSIIHFAGLKAVGESVEKPLEYYHNNLTGTLNLLSLMREFDTRNIVFSSSATVYGLPKSVPIREDFPLSTTNPYGETKLMIERILADYAHAAPHVSACILRYFNPIGAHKSGLIGEDPKGIPNNLLPYIAKVAMGQLPVLHVFGDDYDTHDGTGVRDFIHVVDLAQAHLAALKRAQSVTGVEYYNIGTGMGYSVLEVVRAFEQASGKKIPYEINARRPGDIGTCYADPTKASNLLGWKAKYGILEMCEDSWKWIVQNPNGYTED